MFLAAIWSSLCFSSSMYRFIPPLVVLTSHDSNVAVYAQVFGLFCVLRVQDSVLEYFCPKQGQDFKTLVAPLYPNMSQVSSGPLNQSCIFFYFQSAPAKVILFKVVLCTIDHSEVPLTLITTHPPAIAYGVCRGLRQCTPWSWHSVPSLWSRSLVVQMIMWRFEMEICYPQASWLESSVEVGCRR